MVNASDIENFTRGCSKMFCKIAYPRKIIIGGENALYKNFKKLKNKSDTILAFSYPGMVIGVFYDRILKYFEDDISMASDLLRFNDAGNLIGFIICHELSHLEQDVNGIIYENYDSYKACVESANNRNTAKVLLENYSFYNMLLNKYFNTNIDKKNLLRIKKESMLFSPLKRYRYKRCETIKKLLDRDLRNMLYKDTERNEFIEDFIKKSEYHVFINSKNKEYKIGTGSVYNNSFYEFECIEKLYELLTYTDTEFKIEVSVNDEHDIGWLTIFLD